VITGELKSEVDRIWDAMWSGGISNPLSVIEQLTYLLFIKRLDELHTLREHKAARIGHPVEEPIFGPDENHLRWSRFKETAPERMFVTVKDEVFPFIKSLGGNGGTEEEGDSTYSHHMKDAIFMMPTPRVLANVVDQLDGIDMTDADTKGDLYENMLGKIASAGQNGQGVRVFRGTVHPFLSGLHRWHDLQESQGGERWPGWPVLLFRGTRIM